MNKSVLGHVETGGCCDLQDCDGSQQAWSQKEVWARNINVQVVSLEMVHEPACSIWGEYKKPIFKSQSQVSQQRKLRWYSPQKLQEIQKTTDNIANQGEKLFRKKKCLTFIMQWQIRYWNLLFTFRSHSGKGGKKTHK